MDDWGTFTAEGEIDEAVMEGYRRRVQAFEDGVDESDAPESDLESTEVDDSDGGDSFD